MSPSLPDTEPVDFGPYQLLRRLAKGGMAEVFLAREPRAQRLVAVKRMLPALKEEPDFVAMFLQEARIAAQLHHPSIVELYDLGTLGDSLFLAMEFIDGADLRRLQVKTKEGGGLLPVPVAAHVVARLCEGLAHAHERRGADGLPLGIVHRDISPQNVMVSFGGAVKLVDFGIARATTHVTRTRPGVIKGKLSYVCPEAILQRPLDARSDLFSVGTVLYECLVGKNPFTRGTPEGVLLAIRDEMPPPPATLRADCPAALSRVVMACLEKEPSRRIQTAAELARAVDAAVPAEQRISRQGLGHHVQLLLGELPEATEVTARPSAELPIPDVRPLASRAPPPVAPGSSVPTLPVTGPRPMPHSEVSLPTVSDSVRDARRPTVPRPPLVGQRAILAAAGVTLTDEGTVSRAGPRPLPPPPPPSLLTLVLVFLGAVLLGLGLMAAILPRVAPPAPAPAEARPPR